MLAKDLCCVFFLLKLRPKIYSFNPTPSGPPPVQWPAATSKRPATAHTPCPKNELQTPAIPVALQRGRPGAVAVIFFFPELGTSARMSVGGSIQNSHIEQFGHVLDYPLEPVTILCTDVPPSEATQFNRYGQELGESGSSILHGRVGVSISGRHGCLPIDPFTNILYIYPFGPFQKPGAF